MFKPFTKVLKMKETTIIIPTSVTVQTNDNIPQDEIIGLVKYALCVDYSRLPEHIVCVEENQIGEIQISETRV